MNVNCCPPPARLQLASDVVWASLAPSAPFALASTRGRRAAVAAGIRYERKAQAHLASSYPLAYAPGPWLRYCEARSDTPRYCQPDGLFLDLARGICTIVEIKLKHTADAWWQLRRLYEPVMRQLFRSAPWDFACLEVVRWYDPATAFPEPHLMARDPRMLSPGQFGVHIWSGRPT